MNVRSTAPWRALLLLSAVAASCAGTKDVDVTSTARLTVDAHVGKSFTSDSSRIENLSSHFAPNEAVYAMIDVPGREDGTLKIRWVYGAEGAGETVLEQTVPLLPDKTAAYRFMLPPPEGGLKAGSYRLEVYVNDTLKETEMFEVGA
jgi:hypothetical protein